MKKTLAIFAAACLLIGLARAQTPDYGTNLWLQISSVTNGNASLILHHTIYTQTGEVFEVWSKTNLTIPGWNIETDVWAVANQNWTPFTVPMLDRTNLFILARDWTGIDENSNGIPDWWEYEHPSGLLPVIIAQPASQIVVQGNDVTFSVGVSSNSTIPLSYQWYFNGTNIIPWATANAYTKLVVVPADAGTYDVAVTNIAGAITSSNVSLTVIVPPIFTQQPTNLTVNLTSNATFSASVNSNSTIPLSYQWLWNGNVLAGATNVSLTVANVQATNVGYYSVVVTNAAGTNNSLEASLTVKMLNPSLTNTSALKLNGTAVYTNTSDGRVLELTPAIINKAGSAFFLTRVMLTSNASFSTFFSFRMSKRGGVLNTESDNITGADGIVFVVQTLANNLGTNGGGMGYYGITNSAAVEFDTWFNSGTNGNGPTFDPQLPSRQTNANGSTGDGNHVGIDYNGFITNAFTVLRGITTNGYGVVYKHITNDMNDGNVWYAWIDYSGATSNLEVRLSTNSARPVTPTLTNTVNLLNYLQTSNAYLGFTAGTGSAYEQQDILTWQFISPYHPIGSANPVPSVAITSPTNNTVFLFGPPFSLQATAFEQGGTITNVQFLNWTTNLLGTAVVGANNTYAFAWANPQHGSNALTAVATDNDGLNSTSAVVYVIMNSPPTVSAGTNQTLVWVEHSTNIGVNLQGSVSDDGLPTPSLLTTLWSRIAGPTNLSFADATRTNTTVTFSAPGIYTLQLTAWDGQPLSANDTVTITVEEHPSAPTVLIVTPSNGDSFAAPATIRLMSVAQDRDGVVTNVDYYINNVFWHRSISSPYRLSLTNVLEGTNQFVAVAWNNRGLSATSPPVNVIVLPRAPVVSIVTPQSNAVFSLGEPIVIQTTASDVDGVVTNVQFRAGTFVLGNDTNAPYSITWSNAPQTPPLGTNLFAVATDNDGLSTTSAPVLITVNDGCANVSGVSSLALSVSEIVGGGQLSGTIILSSAATTGGQAVNLYSSSANVTVPSYVWIPESQRSNSFPVSTVSVTVTNMVIISAAYHYHTNGNVGLIVLPSGTAGTVESAVRPGFDSYSIPGNDDYYNDYYTGAPADIGFPILFYCQSYSNLYVNNNGLLTFVRHYGGYVIDTPISRIGTGSSPLNDGVGRPAIAPFWADVDTRGGGAALTMYGTNTIDGHKAFGATWPGVGFFYYDSHFQSLTNTFQVVLIDRSDTGEGNFDIEFNYGTIQWETGDASHNGEWTTDGFGEYSARFGFGNGYGDGFELPGSGISRALLDTDAQGQKNPQGLIYNSYNSVVPGRYIFPIRCNSSGPEVFVRDDKTSRYSPFTITPPGLGAGSVENAIFDTRAIIGNVLQMYMQRCGAIQHTSGARMDLELGVASMQGPTNSFGLLWSPFQTVASPTNYLADWALPTDFSADLQNQLNGDYQVQLTNRLSSVCGDAYTVTDTPNTNWPIDKNILTFEVATDRSVPQGRCRSFVLDTSDTAPRNGEWDILLFDRIIASSGNLKSWHVEEDYTVFNGFTITAPESAAVGGGYELRVRRPDWLIARSVRFSVAPKGTLNSAPVLLPVLLSTNMIASPATVALTISLDSPAPFGDAYVTLRTNGLGGCVVPSWVVIPAGQTSITTPIQVSGSSVGTLEILASYNGYRKAMVHVVTGCQTPDYPQILSVSGTMNSSIALVWGLITNATSYNVSRSINGGGFELIFSGLTATNFEDADVIPGTNNYSYTVTALSNWCENVSAPSSPIRVPYPQAAPAPWIIPFGGIFNDQVDVLLTNFVSGSTIYYTTNGTALGTSSDSFLNGRTITLTDSATIRAFANNSSYSLQSSTVSANFTIVHPAPISCDDTLQGALTRTNAYSTVFGAGRYCSRYAFTAGTNDIGEFVTITASSTSFDTFLLVKNASTNVLFWNDDSADDTTDSQVTFRVPVAGVYVIELTSYQPQEVGDFTLTLACEDTAILNVFTNAYPAFTNNSAPLPVSGLIDFGTINTGTPVTNYITLTNSGSAPLVISNIAVYPSASTNSGNGFSISPTNNITLPSSAITNIGITLLSTQLSDFDGYFIFESNDGGAVGNQPQNPFWARVVGSVRAASGPPQVSIYYPTNGLMIPVTNSTITNVTLEIDAVAMDADGIQKVDFLTNGFLFQTVSNAPYAVVWTNPPAGQHILTAKAYDNATAHNSTVSAGVTITVGSPLLTLSPTNPCVGISNTQFSITATLQNAGGSPVANTNVTFNVSGAHAMTNIARLTDASGQATLTYTGTNYGADWIFASATAGDVPVQAEPVIKNWARNVTCENTYAGSLAETDGYSIGCNCDVPARWSDFYNFTGNANDIVTFTMRSTNFSTYMFVLTNCASLNATNDALNTDDTQIRMTLPATGSYILEASSSDIFQTGDYTVQIACGATPAPDIAALVSGTNLPSFGILDFGTTTNNIAVARTITITNKGNATLTNSGYSITLPNVFSITPSPVTNLVAGSAASFTLRFLATNSAQYAASLVLTNNDPDENPFVVNLSAISNPAGTPPTVWIVTPTNGASFVSPAGATITATATAYGATIDHVDFYENSADGQTLIGRSTNGGSYSVGWNQPVPGTYALRAVAQDNIGRITVSAPVIVEVQPAPGPVITLAPTNVVVGLVNGTHTVTATLRNAFGNIVSGGMVAFAVTGANPSTVHQTTDTNGLATLTYTGTQAGMDIILASATLNSQSSTSAPVTMRWAQRVNCNDQITAALDNTDGFAIGDKIGAPSHYSDLYYLTGSAGDIVTFTMTSTNFSTFMFLMGTDCSPLTVTNEMLNLTDIQMRVTLPSNGTYIVEATSADIFKTGNYNLIVTCGAPTAPDIAVSVNGTNLVNYALLDLGTTTNGTPLTRTIGITNKGNATLNLTGYSWYHGLSNVFSITPSPVMSLSAGTGTNFTLQFRSTNSGQYMDALILTNNDPNKNPFVINLNAISNPDGTPPTVSLTAPTNNASYISPATINIQATATNTSGAAITNVVFLFRTSQGTNLIGNDTTRPYSIDWTMATPGNYDLLAVAYDNQGRIAISPPVTNVQVRPSTQNRPPVANNDHLVVLANSVNNTLDVLANDTDPDGDSLTIISVTPPANGTNAIINNGKAIRYTPPQGVQGYPADGFSYEISDGKGGTALGKVLVDVCASAMPSVILTATAYTTNAGALDPLIATITNVPPQYIAKVEFYLGQTLIGVVTNGVNGIYTLNWIAVPVNCDCDFTATAYDVFGQMNTSLGIKINVQAPSGKAPVAQIDNLADTVSPVADQIYTSPATISDGLFDLIGRAYDEDSPDIAWQLQLYTTDGTLLRDFTPRPVDGSGFHPGSVGSAAASGLLTTCDFTTVPNGIYDLVLRASGGYVVTEKKVHVCLNTQLKIGQFSFSQQDLVIPAGGLPLAVIRTYNSLNASAFSLPSSDFGPGWTFAINSMDVALDETRENRQDLDGHSFSLRTGGGRDVTLTLPDGRRVTFVFTLVPGEQGYRAFWNAPPGVHATLTPTVNNQLTILPGTFADGGQVYYIPPYWTATGAGTSWENYDFPSFILTTQDGTQYVLTRESLGEHFFLSGYADDYYIQAAYDKPVLSKIIQPSGEKIVINTGNSGPSNGQLSVDYLNAAGQTNRSIYFQRDSEGRIIAVTDPISRLSTLDSRPVVKYEYDDAGNLSKVLKLVDRSTGSYVTNQYFYENSAFPHYITSIIDPRGVQVARQLFDDTGKLIGIIDANGHTNVFVHDLANRTETVFDRMGNQTIYGYDTRGNVTTEIDALGHVTLNTYDDQNNVTSTTDALTNTTFYGYDSYGYRNAITNALGETTHFNFDSVGQLHSKSDALGNITSFDYDSAGHRTKVTDALNHSTTFGHDVYGRPAAVTNALNQLRATAGSDNSGNLQFVSQAGGIRMDFGHDSNGNTTNTSFVWVNPNNTNQTQTLATITELDAANRVTRVTDPDNQSRMTIYDSDGRVAQSIDRMGNTNSYIYDALGNVIQTTYADGSVTRNVYDDGSRVIYTDDRHLPGLAANGNHNIYDPAGRVSRTERLANVQIDIVQEDGIPKSTLTLAGAVLSASSTAYDAAGRVLAVTNALGYVTQYEYDPAGRQTAVIDTLNNRTDNVYDDGGRLIASANALLQLTRYQYDAKGRRIATIFPDNSYTTNSYNEIGQLMFVKDQAGLKTDYEYDNLGRMTAVVKPQVFNPEGNTNASPRYEYDHDSYGNILAIRDPKGHQTKFTYDYLGEPISRTLPLLQTNRQSYNALGQLDISVDFKGQSNRFVYDSFGRMATNLLYAAGSSVPSQTNVFIYDANSRLYQTLRPEGISTFQYNIDGAVTNILSPEGRISYEYDPTMGYLTRAYTINSDVRYGYDELSRLKTVSVVKRDGAPLTPWEVTANTYTPLGSLENVYFPNGTWTVYQYDVMNHLTNEVHYNGANQLLAQYQYTVASDSTRLASTETRLESGSGYSTTAITWSNDALRRLVKEASSSTVPALNFTSSYVYDLAGNRLWKTNVAGATPVVTAYTYNANDQLLVESTGSTSFTNSYDANGSVTNRSSASEANVYSYNLEGRLATATINQQTNRYYYNQSGTRVREEMTGSVNTTNIFLNDPQNLSGFSQVLEELPAIGMTPTVTYTLGSQVIAQEKDGTVSFLMSDGHGSTRLLTDTNGAVINAFTYDGYGTLIASNAVPQTVYLYSGERFDSDLQQYYLRARYYNPAVGRFGVQDQMDGTPTDPLSLHKYAYCQNNPVNMHDPTGNQGDIGSMMCAMNIGLGLDAMYNGAVLGAGYIAAKKVTEIGAATESLWEIVGQNKTADTAAIIVHGVAGHPNGWSQIPDKGTGTSFQEKLTLPQNDSRIPGIQNPALNQDLYEFDWGGFSIANAPPFLYPIKSVHQMALVHLQMAEFYVWMNGYANINIISHSWGTTLTYDLQQNSSIETHHWVTMGSVLKESTDKPVGVTGNWINLSSPSDIAYYLGYYPPFPNSILDFLRVGPFGPNVHSDPNVDIKREFDFGPIYSHWAHSDYWTKSEPISALRLYLQ